LALNWRGLFRYGVPRLALPPRLQRALRHWDRCPLPAWGPLRHVRAHWQQRVMVYALLLSLLTHALVLSLQHSLFASRPRAKSVAQSLDVVLVNSRTRSAPVEAQVQAQANLDGGGNTDADRRAKSPLPSKAVDRQGDALYQAQQRVRELEAKQRQLLTQSQAASTVAAPPTPPRTEMPPESTPSPSGRDMAANAMAMVRNLEAQVARNTDDYNKRPRKMFVGVRATEYRFAQYVDDWRQKVERFGNLNYPDTARGKVYGSLRMSVSINPDGSLAGVEIERSSGHKLLDAAAERIVRMAAPYARFPENIRRDVDVLVITRTWHFEQGDRVMTE
jgi:protein TonB